MSRDVGSARGDDTPPSERGGLGGAPISATALLGTQVVLDRVRLGTVEDVLLGADLGVVLGLQVETEAGRSCFLPWAGAVPANGCVFVALPTLLLGDVELEYYVASGIRLSEIVDVDLGENGQRMLLRDITFDSVGSTHDVVVAAGGARRRSVSVGDLRVHWSAGQTPRVALVRKRRARGPDATEPSALAVRRRAA